MFGGKETAVKKNIESEGVYKGVKYRFDGDSLMLTCSSGVEMQFGPAYGVTPEQWVNSIKLVKEGKLHRVHIDPYKPTLRFQLSSDAHTEEGNLQIRRMDCYRDWGIDGEEYFKLESLAEEIFVAYIRSHKE